RPLRPHEAEKAKKAPSESFEIPEDIKQRIENIQKIVTKTEDTREKGDPRNLDFIRGMQIRILESLDKVHEQLRTLDGSPKETRISRIPLDGGNDHAIRDLKEDVQRIASKIESLD
ncbi:2259_t:CDS:2, partial [Racocetra fulgida]